MTQMMQGRSKKKSLAELLQDPEQLQKQIKIHEEATVSRKSATDAYVKAKAQAQATLDLLNKKQLELDKREKELDQLADQYRKWEMLLNTNNSQLEKDRSTFDNEKAQFEESKLGAMKAIQEEANKVSKKEDDLNQKNIELTRKLSEAENKHYELMMRETSVSRREAFLLHIVNQLKNQ